MVKPATRALNEELAVAARRRELETTLRLVEDGEVTKICDARSYAMLINAYADASDSPNALKWLRKSAQAGFNPGVEACELL